MTEEKNKGKYVYCIVGTEQTLDLGPIGIGEQNDRVYSFCHQGLSAVISDSLVKKYPISRKNTIAHQKILEELMGKGFTVLPVRFSTIAEIRNGSSPEDMIRRKVLVERQEELKELLGKMDSKIELGLKAIWPNMENVFKEIVEENNSIKKLKEQLLGKPADRTRTDRVRLGEMVKAALESKKERLKEIILGVLKDLTPDLKMNKNYNDSMILNVSFLIDKARTEDFDSRINKLSENYGGKIKFKYVGPIPPISFVEIVINWE